MLRFYAWALFARQSGIRAFSSVVGAGGYGVDRLRLAVDSGCGRPGDDAGQRPRVEQALVQVFGRAGLVVKRTPSDHAGGKWRLSYSTALGRPGSIEVDLNFMLRTPLWPPTRRDSCAIGNLAARDILVLDDHELAAGKLVALVARSASRDLFDAASCYGAAHLMSTVCGLALLSMAASTVSTGARSRWTPSAQRLLTSTVNLCPCCGGTCDRRGATWMGGQRSLSLKRVN